MNKYLLLLSGGVGSRFKGDIPKQYTKNKDDISILFMSVKPFVNVGFKKAFIVCDPSWEKFIKEELNVFDIELFFAKNGKERQDSIDNGIDLIFKTQDINEEDVVVVQEAVRPFVSNELVEELLAADKSFKTVSPAINPAVLYGSFNANEMTSDRLLEKSSIIELQLPKRHNLSFYKGHRSELNKDSSLVLDESEVFINAGEKIHLTKGDFKNIKITYPIHRIIVDMYKK